MTITAAMPMRTTSIKDRLSRFWTYRWSVTLDGRRYDVHLEAGWRCNTFVVSSGGDILARDVHNFYAEQFRLQELTIKAAADSLLTFRTGPHNLISYGLEVTRDGAVAYRSHPEPFAGMKIVEKLARFGSSEAARRQAEHNGEIYPALAADIGLSVLLYFAAGYMSLRETAILGAAVVLMLMLVDWGAKRFFDRKLNLTGGFSTLAVGMLLLSAGYAWLVENELAIMLKSSALGLIAACMLAADAMLGGKYIGKRVSQYITFVDIHPRRFSWGSAMAGASQSLLSAAVAIWLSRDIWLLYRHWIGPVLGLTLGIVVLVKSRRKPV